jgi:Xaa-Pro aminopeptidase
VNAEPRLAALRRRLVDEEIDAFLVTSEANQRYLTGFEGVFDDNGAGLCLVTAASARYYTDFRYQEVANAAAEDTPWMVHIVAENLYVNACDDLRSLGAKVLGIESSMPYGRFRFVSEKFQGRVVSFDQLIEELRQIKESAEIDAIAAAAALGDRAFEHVLATIRPGVREVDVALTLESFMRGAGSEGLGFDSIVASGPNSSRPHAGVTDRAIETGEFLTMDFGARIGGYCSDMTRTVVVGKANDRQREVYAAVLDANMAALAAVKPGLPGEAIDAVARDLLTARGWGEAFGHGLGHGVGLHVHELPRVGRNSRDPVRAGSVITIEPGVYLPGFGGVRIEDLIVVEEGGCRLLSHSPKDLIEL